MAQIKKLQLQGIRSFGPEDKDRQNVEFFSPLTLILGQNGCGKTTIIECLKYVTTGDLPPGSYRGASFVHDPKMARENIVRGQAKLLFTNPAGHEKIIARSMEVAQKLKTITMKTLDSTVTTKYEDGKITQISSKCADVNADVLISLGVSKPILNYVIFCHQEDSNWPLEEGKKVKEKFDEIFNSAKYKNCLNHIKEVRSKQMVELKEDKINMSHFKSDKELYDEKTREWKKKTKELDKREEEIAELETRIAPIQEDLVKVSEEEKGFAYIQKELIEAQTQLGCVKDHTKQLKKQVKEIFPESVTVKEIERMGKQLEEERLGQDKILDDLNKDIRDANKEEQIIGQKIQRNAGLIGQLVSDKTKYERDCEKKRKMAKEASEQLGVTDDPDDMMSILTREGEKIKNQVRRKKQEDKEMDIRIGEEIDQLKEEKTRLVESKKREVQAMIEAKKEIAQITKQLAEMEASGRSIHQIQEECQQVEKKLQSEKGKVDLDAVKEEIDQLRDNIRRLEGKESALKEERKGLEEKQDMLNQIEYNNEAIKRNEDRLNVILNKRHSDFLEIFESTPDKRQLRTEFKDGYEKVERQLRDLQTKRVERESELKSKRQARKEQKVTRDKKTVRANGLDDKIRDVLADGEVLEDEVQKAADELALARKELQVKEAGKFTYKEMLDRMDKLASPACPTCNREFERRMEADELRRDLESMIRDIPKRVKTLEEKVTRLEARQGALQKIAPDVVALADLQKDIDAGTKTIEDLDKTIKVLEEEGKKGEASYTRLNETLDIYKDLSDDVQKIDGLVGEISRLEDLKQDLTLSCPVATDGKSLKEVREEEERINDEVRDSRTKLEEKENVYNTTTRRINELESSFNKLTNRRLEIESKQQQRTTIEAKKKDLEEKRENSKVAAQKFDEDLRPLVEKLDEKEAERSRLRKSCEDEMDQLTGKERRIETYLMEIKSLCRATADYLAQNKEAKFEEEKRRKKELEEERDALKERKQLAEEKSREIKDNIANQINRKRNLEDNLKLRDNLERESKLLAQVSDQEKRLNNMNWKAVEAKRKKLQDEKNFISAEINSKNGEIYQLRRTVAEMKKELDLPKFKDAARKYKETSVRCKTRQMAVDDLNKYYIALDFAIMRFHQEKMKVVNQIIRELWRAVYRGNDIDFIEIKTDDTENVGGADKRRSFNYRVVMVKNNTEMDMRGRCSAGQKVLASLIIRLALAETFSSSCGIIALDEPTTNLDRENIESLAVALTDIAMKQAHHRTFQLVIITHDEEFIEQLSRCEKIHYYQRVTRNSRGISEIRKVNVASFEQ